MGGITKFKLLTQRLLSGLGKSKSFFPFYDSENDADYRVSLDTLITFISNELGVSSKAVFELTNITGSNNDYISDLNVGSYKTEALWIFKPNFDSDNTTTLRINSLGILPIKEFNGTSLINKSDVKSVNTYLLLNKTTYWLVVGGVSGTTVDFIPLEGTNALVGDITTGAVGTERTIGYNESLVKGRLVFSYVGGFAESWLQSKVNNYEATIRTLGFDGAAQVQLSVGNGTTTKTLVFASEETTKLQGDIIRLDDTDRNSQINSEPKALITKEYADAHYLGDSGTVNTGSQYQLVYYAANGTTISPLTLITGNRALISNANGLPVAATTTSTEIGYLNGVTSSIQTQLNNKQGTMSIASDAEMQSGTDNVKYTTALRTATWWTWVKSLGQTISGLWTFASGITISGGRLLFTNTSTASGDGWYRQASNILRAAINGTDRFEINSTGVKTKGTHTFENTIFTNLTPTVKKIATIQTTGELTGDYTPTTIYQGIQRNLQTLVSSTTETPVFNPELGSTLIPIGQYFNGVQLLYTIPFKLSTTGTVRFLVRFGEAATALTSRTILADTGTFSPAVTAQGGVLKVFFSVGTIGGSGTAVLICNIECQINGKNPVITFPLRTSSGVSTLVDNLLEITCVFGTSSASNRIDVENANAIKIS